MNIQVCILRDDTIHINLCVNIHINLYAYMHAYMNIHACLLRDDTLVYGIM
jgi:hypothetical protein